MSTVMRPRGPLPARVYWTRRVLLVVLVMAVFALVWWWVPDGGGSRAASADPGHRTPTGPTTPATTGPPPTTPATTGTQPPTTQPPTTRHSTTEPPPTTDTTSTPPLSVPTGPCDPATVALAIDVEHEVMGAGNRIGLRMSTTDGSTCSFGVAPSRVEIRITSGPATVWNSNNCRDGLPAKNVVVRPEPAVVYSVRWDGHIDLHGCRPGVRVAQPGGYWVTAALVGGEPNRAYFDVIAAPAKG